ncbi:MAG: thioredoxin family protein [bacterium]|nr:thioredoxin family protein [bacterium]
MKIVVISSMWCPACINMYKVWTKVEEEYKDIEVVKYDYDVDEEIVKKFEPGDILPVTIIFENEIEKSRLCGEKTFEDIKKIIEE